MYITFYFVVRQVSQASEDPRGKLMSKEERMRGSVSWRVYWFFIKSLGVPTFFIITFLLITTNAIQIGTNFLLSEWSEKGANTTNETTPVSNSIMGRALSFVKTGKFHRILEKGCRI